MELKRQELHQMGMNVVGKHLEENGFEFLAIKSESGSSPQFVCMKNEKEFFLFWFEPSLFLKIPKVTMNRGC